MIKDNDNVYVKCPDDEVWHKRHAVKVNNDGSLTVYAAGLDAFTTDGRTTTYRYWFPESLYD